MYESLSGYGRNTQRQPPPSNTVYGKGFLPRTARKARKVRKYTKFRIIFFVRAVRAFRGSIRLFSPCFSVFLRVLRASVVKSFQAGRQVRENSTFRAFRGVRGSTRSFPLISERVGFRGLPFTALSVDTSIFGGGYTETVFYFLDLAPFLSLYSQWNGIHGSPDPARGRGGRVRPGQS
jgi:hypothetical protein